MGAPPSPLNTWYHRARLGNSRVSSNLLRTNAQKHSVIAFFHQREEGWEDVDDDEEAIDVSGSPFAPASDYLGKRLDD